MDILGKLTTSHFQQCTSRGEGGVEINVKPLHFVAIECRVRVRCARMKVRCANHGVSEYGSRSNRVRQRYGRMASEGRMREACTKERGTR